MAIYKLKELFKMQQGLQIPITERYEYGKDCDKYITVAFLKNENENYYVPQAPSSVRVTAQELLIVRTGLTGKPVYKVEGVFHNNFFKVIPKNNLINLEYFYYWSIKNEKYVFSMGNGSTIKDISHKVYGSLDIDIPSIDTQQEIIDIIKPIEQSIEVLNSIQKNIKKLETSLMFDSTLSNVKFNYSKGGLAGGEGATTFLNVASANGNPNRYVNNEPNIFIGDVTLSLDGNCGLVNNCLEGYNGYLYKVTAQNIPSWQVFYSLKTNHSQNIIKLNETGTTIKHASGAKKELVVHNFENSELLQSLFSTRIQIYKMKLDLEKKLQYTIKLLIK